MKIKAKLEAQHPSWFLHFLEIIMFSTLKYIEFPHLYF